MDLPTLPLTSPAWLFLVLVGLMLVMPILAERLHLPGVVGLMLGGLLVGPEALHLVNRAGTVEELGSLGLLYLMFVAGLELDLTELSRRRGAALVFGALTFGIPFVLGVGAGYGFEVRGRSAIVLGLLFASQTLVAYPIVRALGLTANRAVATTVGATVVTDTLALVVLAVVVGGGDGSSPLEMMLRMGGGLAALAAFTVWVLPAGAELFFRGPGIDRPQRFVFVLFAFVSTAAFAEAFGIEPIVGAFFAGLALNRKVPSQGPLMDRMEFVGTSFLIPLFLISVGMLVDPELLIDPETLALAGVLTALALIGKAIAAWVAGRVFGFSTPEIGVMFGLSGAHAAATLAATAVAFDAGLFEQRIVNAVVVVILVTIVAASWAARRWAPRIGRPESRRGALGRVVVVSVSNPDSARGLVGIGAMLAKADGGLLVPLHVTSGPDLSGPGAMLREVAESAGRLGVEIETRLRVDASTPVGITNTVTEMAGTVVVVGWKGSSRIDDLLSGSILDEIVRTSPAPVLACRIAAPIRRIVVAAGNGETSAALPLRDAVELGVRLRSGGVPLVILSDDLAVSRAVLGVHHHKHLREVTGDRIDAVCSVATDGDLVILPGPHSDRDGAALAQRLPAVSLVVVAGYAISGGTGLASFFG
ncbi:MAG: hypothetical protein A2Z12_07940 [Actinobacteria bacterium RBG_16_68_21]|nr:MAG: hypothetical protein A2Z12_07940 [Actinobacteria bacterium RBG_16_68_21]